MADVRRFLRDNLVLVAAFGLPAMVAVLFILATAIPRWTVPNPQHDLVLRIDQSVYGHPVPEVSVELELRDGHVEAVVRSFAPPKDPNVGVTYPRRWMLFLFDHTTMQLREIPMELPRTLPPGETRTVVLDALAGRYVVAGDMAPDGYKVTSLNTNSGGGGIVGELFGMNRRYRRGLAIGKGGRTIEIDIPSPYGDSFGAIVPIGWTR